MDSAPRTIILDLIYPAVLGTMIVLIFLRIASTGEEAILIPTTIIGIIISIYYIIGFVRSKNIPVGKYNKVASAIDASNSIAIFLCFYLLGFTQNDSSSVPILPYNKTLFYFVLLYIFIAPVLIRYFVFYSLEVMQKRNIMCYAMMAASLIGIIGPFKILYGYDVWFIIAVYVSVFIWYFIDLARRGFSAES